MSKEDPAKVRARCRAWHKKNKNKRRDYRRLKQYGISPAQWDALFASQGHVCAVCFSPDHSGKNWQTDHCHATGKVRGILCSHCNLMLGHAKDNKTTLASAIRYLDTHQ